MTYRSIFWGDDQARLKNFSASSKAGARSVVKIEIEIRDPYRLGSMLQDLDEIMRAQAAAERPPVTAPKPHKSSRREIESKRPLPLLLTYRED